MQPVTVQGSRVVGLRFTFVSLLFLASFVALRVDTLHAQTPPNARMLRRVAEAVDGHRSGRDVWVVVSQLDTGDVIGVFESRDSALAAARANPTLRPAVMGQYSTVRDGTAANRAFLIGCVHDPRSSMVPPRPYCPAQVIPFGDIDSLTLTIHKRDGTRLTLPVPRSADAMFFSLSAIDKFVLPYYTRVLGAEQSAAMRRRIVSGIHF